MTTRWLRIGRGVMATGVLAAAVWWCLSSEVGLRRWLARSWARRLPHNSAEQVSRDLRYIAALDEAGLDAMLDAIGSSRTTVSEVAVQALRERLEVWRQWPHERSNQLAGQLARGLAERVGGWPEGSQRVAADIALQLLDWPTDTQRGSRSQLLADCERILRSVPAVSAADRESPAKPSEPLRLGANKPASQPGRLARSSSSADDAKVEFAEPAQLPDLEAGLAIQTAETRQPNAPAATSITDITDIADIAEPSQIDTGGSTSKPEAGLSFNASPTSDTPALGEPPARDKDPAFTAT